MVLQLFVGILAIVAVFLMVSRKRRRLWPPLMFLAVLVLGALFFEHYHLFSGRTITYHWLAYKTLQAQFIITSDNLVTASLQWLLPLVAALLGLNILCRREENPLTAGNLMLLCIAAFIFMVSSKDFIQLMAGSCCFSILGFYLINQTLARSRFIFYNFAAEMAVFTALAVVFAKTGSINLNTVGSFARIGGHKDLVALLLLLGILAKCGMFMFQNQLLDLRCLSFNRLIGASLLGAPISGLVLFLKLQGLLSASTYTAPILQAILLLSAAWALIGLLWNDSLKARVLYFNMLFFTFALFWMNNNPELFFSRVVVLLPIVLLVDWCLMLPSVSASDEVYVSQMGGFWRRLKGTLMLSIAAVIAFGGAIIHFGIGRELTGYLICALLPLSAVFHSIYFGSENADERVVALLRHSGWGYLLLPLLGVGAAFYYLPPQSSVILAMMSATFIGLTLFLPQKLANFFAGHENLQENDWLIQAYQLMIVSPLRLLGRILWLAVDFVVIERSVMGTVVAVSDGITRSLEKVQTTSLRSFWWLTALGLALLLLNIGMFAYE